MVSTTKNTNTFCGFSLVLSSAQGDPHRVLLAYSLTSYKKETESDGNIVVEVSVGGEKQRIKIVDHDLISFVAQELLKKLGKATTPDAAREYIDSMVCVCVCARLVADSFFLVLFSFLVVWLY